LRLPTVLPATHGPIGSHVERCSTETVIPQALKAILSKLDVSASDPKWTNINPRLEDRNDKPARCDRRTRSKVNRRMNLAIGASGLRRKAFSRFSGIEVQCPHVKHSIAMHFIVPIWAWFRLATTR